LQETAVKVIRQSLRGAQLAVPKIIGVLALLAAAWSAQAQMRTAPELGRQCIYGDCRDGFGIVEIRNEWGTDRYEGGFRDGKYHGHGRFEFMASRTERGYYDGDWSMGMREGRGTHWDGKANLYIGQWRDDLRHGRGSYFFGVRDWLPNKHSEFWLSENVENYSGDFVDDLYQGKGTYRWPDGQRYVGDFFANEKHGPGTFFYPTGTRREQVWRYGRLVR
jgi:hypothetical protein